MAAGFPFSRHRIPFGTGEAILRRGFPAALAKFLNWNRLRDSANRVAEPASGRDLPWRQWTFRHRDADSLWAARKRSAAPAAAMTSENGRFSPGPTGPNEDECLGFNHSE